jgi:hypothetical protein
MLTFREKLNLGRFTEQDMDDLLDECGEMKATIERLERESWA